MNSRETGGTLTNPPTEFRRRVWTKHYRCSLPSTSNLPASHERCQRPWVQSFSDVILRVLILSCPGSFLVFVFGARDRPAGILFPAALRGIAHSEKQALLNKWPLRRIFSPCSEAVMFEHAGCTLAPAMSPTANPCGLQAGRGNHRVCAEKPASFHPRAFCPEAQPG